MDSLAARYRQPGSDLKNRDLFVSRKKSRKSPRCGGVAHNTPFSWLFTSLLLFITLPDIRPTFKIRKKRKGNKRKRRFFPGETCHFIHEGKAPRSARGHAQWQEKLGN